jgi:hypothetical protein
MPFLTARACQNCNKSFTPISNEWLCAECREKSKGYRRADDRDRNAKDEYRKFLQSPAWRKLSEMLRVHNPQCQMLRPDGLQCFNNSAEVHHVLDGRTHKDLRLSPSNLVCLCSACHNNHPGDLAAQRYVPTVMTVFGERSEYPHTT